MLAFTGGRDLVRQARHGNRNTRPSFTPAAPPEAGRRLFDYILSRASEIHPATASGRFGADMQVSLTNDGPVTFWLRVAPAAS